jgi:hypothetical protein
MTFCTPIPCPNAQTSAISLNRRIVERVAAAAGVLKIKMSDVHYAAERGAVDES